MAEISRYILIFDAASLLLIGIPLYYFQGLSVFFSAAIGYIITSAIAIASFYPFTRIRDGSMNQYLITLLSATLFRMAVVGISVALVFAFSDLHQISFTVALLFSYICKSVIETYVLTRKQRGHSSVSQ